METLFEKYLARQKKKKEEKFEVWAKTRMKGKQHTILRVSFYYCLLIIPLTTLVQYLYLDVYTYIVYFVFITGNVITGVFIGWFHWNTMEENYQLHLVEKAEEKRRVKWLSEFMAKK